MASILFIEKKLRADKLGICYLSAVLKTRGHQVDMIQDDLDNSIEYIKSNKPDFIMYSVMTGDHTWFINKNKELKSMFKFTSVMGGPHFTFFPEQAGADKDIDFIVSGPGEEVILDIVEGRATERFITGSIPNIDNLPEPDRSILYKYDEFGNSKMKRFIASRYCIWSCKYCFNHLFRKMYAKEKNSLLQRRNPRLMINEIKNVVKDYGLEIAYFNDDNFIEDKEWLREFLDIYNEEIGIPFCISIRASSATSENLSALYKAKCIMINIALESANESTQKFIRRGFINNSQVRFAVQLSESLGMKVRVQNMIGLPVDDPLQDALDTLKMNIEMNPTDSWVSIFQPFPKTDLWKDTLNLGLIKTDTEAKTFFEGTQLSIKDAVKINRLQKWWYFAIKQRMDIDFIKNVLLELDLTPDQLKFLQEKRWEEGKKILYGL